MEESIHGEFETVATGLGLDQACATAERTNANPAYRIFWVNQFAGPTRF
jgi:hypothetical protein